MKNFQIRDKIRYARKAIAFTLIAITITIKSCGIENLLEFQCSECYPDKPLDSWVRLNLTINKDNPEVPITVYLGSPENGVIVIQEIAIKEAHYIYIENEVAYTVEAKYKVDGRTRIVFNKIETKVFYDYESCSEPCYWVSNTKVNLKIKK